MRAAPYTFMGRPSIKIMPEEADWTGLTGREPSPMDWLAQLVTSVQNQEWRCNASNVFADYVVYVPEWRGFVRPTGKALEKSLFRLLADLKSLLRRNKFPVTSEGEVVRAV